MQKGNLRKKIAKGMNSLRLRLRSDSMPFLTRFVPSILSPFCMRFFRLFPSFFWERTLCGGAANQRGEVNYGLCMDLRRTGWQGAGLDVLLLYLDLEYSAV